MIPLIRPQHVELGLPDPRVPEMRKWVDIMSHHVGVSSMRFTPNLFLWIWVKIVMIEDYTYSISNF